jgi:hypothetical protein
MAQAWLGLGHCFDLSIYLYLTITFCNLWKVQFFKTFYVALIIKINEPVIKLEEKISFGFFIRVKFAFSKENELDFVNIFYCNYFQFEFSLCLSNKDLI